MRYPLNLVRDGMDVSVLLNHLRGELAQMGSQFLIEEYGEAQRLSSTCKISLMLEEIDANQVIGTTIRLITILLVNLWVPLTYDSYAASNTSSVVVFG